MRLRAGDYRIILSDRQWADCGADCGRRKPLTVREGYPRWVSSLFACNAPICSGRALTVPPMQGYDLPVFSGCAG